MFACASLLEFRSRGIPHDGMHCVPKSCPTKSKCALCRRPVSSDGICLALFDLRRSVVHFTATAGAISGCSSRCVFFLGWIVSDNRISFQCGRRGLCRGARGRAEQAHHADAASHVAFVCFFFFALRKPPARSTWAVDCCSLCLCSSRVVLLVSSWTHGQGVVQSFDFEFGGICLPIASSARDCCPPSSCMDAARMFSLIARLRGLTWFRWIWISAGSGRHVQDVGVLGIKISGSQP